MKSIDRLFSQQSNQSIKTADQTSASPYSFAVFLFWASLCNSGIYKKEQNISCPCECVGANKRARGETGWAHIARWEYQYHMAHIYSYVKLNFNKVNMFSCIFWFKDSLLYKIGLFLLFGFFRPKNSLKKLKNYICPRTRPKPKDKK